MILRCAPFFLLEWESEEPAPTLYSLLLPTPVEYHISTGVAASTLFRLSCLERTFRKRRGSGSPRPAHAPHSLETLAREAAPLYLAAGADLRRSLRDRRLLRHAHA